MSADLTAEDEALAALLAGCAAGDAYALERLYRDVSPLLFAALVRILRRRSLAEEVLQEAFVAIWQRAGSYERSKGRPMAWMMSIARYRAIDVVRRERRAPLLVPELPESAADEAGAESADALPLVREAAFERCLALLSPVQRECLQLAFVGGSSHGDIARVTGNALGSVKSWIRRGLESLRSCLRASA